ncbi:MAG TPA: MlaD family protein [Thermoleophilaceae bacterium]|nr:MlaD family protein [Thermoleophilaceae bacterium]
MSGDPRARKLTSGRAIAIAVAAGIALGALFSIAAGGDEDDGYLVRAVFDNGSFVIPGEDVKIAGVVVGAIQDVDLTEDNKAAVVLKVDDPAFVPFREDAQCQIRLQSLIGEQFIECVPTRPREEGEPPKPELAMIEDGRGKGQHLLPADNNITPVGEDLLRNINRLPQREGLRLIINELGAGLAGNGDRLRDAVRRANPALKEFDNWIKVLAEQDRLLGRLIDESDTVLASWVQRREEMADFIDQSGATAVAAAERGDDIERNFERFPGFLRELKPTADRFAGMADQMTPALNNLDRRSEAINAMVQGTGPFFEAATPALVTLGDFADRGRELFPAIRPLIGDLDELGRPLRPTMSNLAKLFGSFDDTGGIEELMQLIYFYTGTVNGVDAKGHYVRTGLVIKCPARSPLEGGCAATLENYGDPVKASADTSGLLQTLQRQFPPTKPGKVVGEDAVVAGVDLNAEDSQPFLDYLLGERGGQ